MGRIYRRKSDRRAWTVEKMNQAVCAVRKGMAKRLASRIFEVPRKTLQRYLANTVEGESVQVKQLGSVFPVFTRAREEELANELKSFSQVGYGLTADDVRRLAYKKAEDNNMQHPFNHSTQLAGPDWLKHFLHRNPSLALRKPEATSMARIKGFNRDSVKKFFDLLGEAFANHGYPASCVWNMDETGFSTVPTKSSKVVAKKGDRHVAGISSAERGITITAIFAMSAAGNYIPPLFIFPRQRMQESWKCGAPSNSKFLCSGSGWSTTETCNKWMDHFLEFAKPTAQCPVLLILDGHSSHTRNISMLEKAKANHVQIISMPPHTSHKLQPLDVAFMGPLKKRYVKAVDAFLRSNPGQVVTLNQICALVKESFIHSATLATALNGFKATGIVPFDPHVFTDADFAASDALKVLVEQDAKKDPHTGEAGNISSNEDAPMVADAETPFVLQGSYQDLYTVPPESIHLIYNSQNDDTEVEEAQVAEANISQTQATDLIEASLDADMEYFVVDPDVYYVIGEDGKISVQTYAEQTPLLEVVDIDVEPLSVAPLMASSVSTSQAEMKPKLKRKRWDQETGLKTKPGDTGFQSCTQEAQGGIEKKKPRKSSRKKEESVDLTSSMHRQKLLKSAAQKDLKLLKKAGRKCGRKTKSAKDIPIEDILCCYCGVCFSASDEGNGWLKCILCQAWFHAECTTSDELSLQCGNC